VHLETIFKALQVHRGFTCGACGHGWQQTAPDRLKPIQPVMVPQRRD
jgi:hypothetical protein